MSQAGDHFIKKNGESVKLFKFTQIVYDEHDNVDLTKSKFKTSKAFMLIGVRKSDAPNLEKGVEGWDYQENLLVVFFDSGVDIDPKEGIDAYVVETSNGKRFRVNRTDFDNILNVYKRKAFLEPLRGDIEL